MIEIVEHFLTGLMVVVFLELYYLMNFDPDYLIETEDSDIPK